MGLPARRAGGRRRRGAGHRDAPRPLSAAATASRSGAWRVLRSRNFGPYWLGNAASASGTWFQNLAAAILVYRLTHSPLLLGVLNFSQFVPALVLAPWAGALADRVDRRKLLFATQLTASALSAGLATLAWLGLARVPEVIAFAAGLGVMVSLSQPAQMALVSSLVPRGDVAQAIALNSAAFNVARAAGPTAAAAIVAWQGVGVAFAVNACSYLLLVAALCLVRPLATVRRDRPRLRDGIAILRRRPALVLYLLVVAAVSGASDPVNTESPALAHAFGHSAAWAGTVVGAFGAGAVVAAFAVAGKITATRTTMTATLAAMGGGMALFAVMPWLEAGWVFLAVAGAGYLTSNTSATTQLQLGVPEHERGRIMALWSIAFLGIRPLASLVDGGIATAFGVRAAAVVIAVPVLAGAVVAAATSRRLPRASAGGAVP